MGETAPRRFPIYAMTLGLPAVAAAALTTLSYLLVTDWIQAHAEGSVIEIFQSLAWLFAVPAALVGVLCKDRHRRLISVWFSVIAALALTRELDLHEALNPESLGSWGVRYRLDWWTDAGVPLTIKGFWFLIGVGIGCAVVLPIARAWPAMLKAIREREAGILAILCCISLLAFGVVLDDIARGLLPREPAQAVEEVSELLGVLLYLSGVVAWASPLWLEGPESG